jgi:hypothetical protein|eukprot:COSAG06_NODE_10770_length_1619_cov_1.107895_2_plen_108_part_00
MQQLTAIAVALALAAAVDAVPTADDPAVLQQQEQRQQQEEAPCAWGREIPGHYLDGWCQSLAPVGTEICGTLRNGTIVPSHWPYDTSSLEAAQAWCCKHVSHLACTD